MADMDNISEINQNFDTIKTLLNSIRAQGILNTSDVDKLLSGINNKLEKINTEEDIDMIKIFLSELKQNLDERHNVLVSKFGAIESLFTNLLKNSSEMPKSSDIKELFDIVATNLSVFSREVVSQKETLTDINLRLDALRSDDSQKKDIIKNITLLKPDLERLNNGFDSIVISLNDNFKTIVKTISTIDKTEYLDRFSDNLKNIEMSSNTVLSALQMLDKKAELVDESLQKVATKDDLNTQNKNLAELKTITQDLSLSVADLSDSYSKMDTLADKIDASVNIIANLKAVLEDSEDSKVKSVLEQLKSMEIQLQTISSDTKFEDFKSSLGTVIKQILDSNSELNTLIAASSVDIQKLTSLINSLEINPGFGKLESLIAKTDDNIQTTADNISKKIDSLQNDNSRNLEKLHSEIATSTDNISQKVSELQNNNIDIANNMEANIKNSINEVAQKISTLHDANVTRLVNDISTEADTLGTKLNQAQTEIALLCEKNFSSVFSNIENVKNLISQIDENSVSANNAIFSSITDRLTVFENSLRESLESQEKTVNNSSAHLVEQIDSIKNLSGVLDYKMDSSVVETGNLKREFESLKTSVENVLALDFVNTVKDLRVDLYASKQELSNAFETATGDLSEKFTNDLYGKYELLISKLDSVSDELYKAQKTSLSDMKVTLERISDSIVDVISYVSEAAPANMNNFDEKVSQIINTIKENSLNYIDEVRDVVNIIKIQVDENLKRIEDSSVEHFDSVKRALSENSEDIKKELKFSYSKLLELQDSYNELKDILNVNNLNSDSRIEKIINSTEDIKTGFEEKIATAKNNLLDKIAEFKQEFTCENADNVSEFKFVVENLYNKTSDDITSLIEDLSAKFGATNEDGNTARAAALAKILDNFVSMKDFINSAKTNLAETFNSGMDNAIENVNSIKDCINTLTNSASELINTKTSTVLAEIDSLKNNVEHFEYISAESIKSNSDTVLDKVSSIKQDLKQISDSAVDSVIVKADSIIENLESVKVSLDRIDENVDSDMTRQLSLIESNFESLVSQVSILFDKSDKSLSEKINIEFAAVSEQINKSVSEKLDKYKSIIEESFNSLSAKTKEQSTYVQDYIDSLNSKLKSAWEEQSAENNEQLEQIAETLKNIIDENTKLTAVDYVALKNKLSEFAKSIEINNQNLTQDLKSQLDDITKYIDSVLDIQVQEVSVKHNEIKSYIDEMTTNTVNSVNAVKAIAVKQLELENTAKDNLAEIRQIGVDNSDKIENIAKEQLQNADKVNAELNNLVQLTTNNNCELKNIENDVKAQHEELLLKENLIYDSVQKIENSANSMTDSVTDIQSNISSLVEMANLSKAHLEELDSTFLEKVDSINTLVSDISAETLQTIDTYISQIKEQLDIEKQQIQLCKDATCEFLQKNIAIVTENIEKETDVIIGDIIEQFDLLRKAQADDIVDITSKLEDIITSHIYDNIESLKSYLDVKTDNSVLMGKLDNLKVEMSSSVDEIINNLSKLLEAGVFTSAMNDFRVANELLVNSAVDRLNAQIKGFLEEYGTEFEDKLALFDKKFIDTVVDKFEEIKLISNKYNDSFNSIQKTFADISSEFEGVKLSINEKIDNLAETLKLSVESTNKEVRSLNECFENLRSQISSKSFDEAFQTSINKQIGNLEALIREQLGYIEDISDLCVNNLPDVTELNTLVKNSILESIQQFTEKLDSQDVEKHLNQAKTDIITQFLNVFNQISFVAEQEEILDFIQDKHDELITVLSHIVTTTSDVEIIKDNLNVVDDKINTLKEDIALINEKITSIISSDGDVDYVYSFQDVESDIASLRVALNEMQQNSNSQVLSDLINSTNEIYNLVESVKTDLPDKQAFENIAEDIVSISTRTNKLILASDESYKTLQDNLQDFKLVINDLDERTRNFAQESGMDKIDLKLNALNSMMQNGAKTNQVFNQVFEYLAEWVDKAGVQINTISDKVETLDDIGQIKVMLQDLKAEAADNSESVELIEALGAVFEKQTKRISVLETKLDKLLVETTINKKFDITPIENTLNSFLVAMDDKISSQQEKIKSLEAKIEGVLSILDEKDTAQLTKKVGGMDRQIAKLNKSIEKIASHVVEK